MHRQRYGGLGLKVVICKSGQWWILMTLVLLDNTFEGLHVFTLLKSVIRLNCFLYNLTSKIYAGEHINYLRRLKKNFELAYSIVKRRYE